MRDVTITMTPRLTQVPVAHVTLLLSDFTEAGLQASPSSYLDSQINLSLKTETSVTFMQTEDPKK